MDRREMVQVAKQRRGKSFYFLDKVVKNISKSKFVKSVSYKSTQFNIIIKLIVLIFKHEPVYVIKTLKILFDIRRHNGIKYMYKYIKAARLHITRYICGKPLKSITNSGVSTKNGWPTRFLYLKDLLRNDCDKRLLLTLLSLSKGINPKLKNEVDQIKPDFRPITDKYTGKLYVIPKYFIEVMCRKYRINGSDLVTPSKNNLFLNMKASSTGKVSIGTAMVATLVHDYATLEHFEVLMLEAYHSVFLKAQNFAFNNKIQPTSCTGKPTQGKLAIVHDAEGKERVIAMSDYWTQ